MEKDIKRLWRRQQNLQHLRHGKTHFREIISHYIIISWAKSQIICPNTDLFSTHVLTNRFTQSCPLVEKSSSDLCNDRKLESPRGQGAQGELRKALNSSRATSVVWWPCQESHREFRVTVIFGTEISVRLCLIDIPNWVFSSEWQIKSTESWFGINTLLGKNF